MALQTLQLTALEYPSIQKNKIEATENSSHQSSRGGGIGADGNGEEGEIGGEGCVTWSSSRGSVKSISSP